MPGLTVDFTEEEYARIPAPRPGKKRGWVRELVRAALAAIPDEDKPVGTVHEEADHEYVFKKDGRVVTSKGSSPAHAAGKIGIFGVVDWMSAEDYSRNGWGIGPLDV